MKKILYTILLLLGLSIAATSQTTKDAAVALSGNVQTGPLRVALNWPAPTAADVVLFRREKDSTTWFVLLNQAATTVSTFTDPLVTAGKVYEYGIQRTVNGVAGFGYLSVALERQAVEKRGQMLVFCEAALSAPLAFELERLRQDLAGDGWDVRWYDTPANATVATIKNQIIADYNAAPQQVKSVLLLGAIPVPYSGNTAWDAHPEHAGAWPADTYYGDVNGLWTDNSVNNTTPARPENDNVPGDGKFDQSVTPSASELAVGRVDFSNLSEASFGATQVQLMRRYLDKNHRWRVKEYTVDNKMLVDDNFGFFNSEAFAANGFRNGYALSGAANVVEGDFLTGTDNQRFLFGYGCGGGTYTSAGGVGTSADFAADSINVVFSMIFGSYHGDWDYAPNPLLPSVLASRGGILSVAWAGRPHWFFQHLNAGETIGYSTQETQNTCNNVGYPAYYGACGTHVTLLGDPSLRAHIVAPATNLALTPQCDAVRLNWTPSADPAVAGYQVFRSTAPHSGYTKIHPGLVNGSYTDPNPPADTLYYQVRAVKLENPIAGSYWNTSTGIIKSVIYIGGTPPDVSADGGLITCYNETDTLRGFSSTPGVSYHWTGPNGFSANTQNAPTSAPGVYTLVVTAPNSCTAGTTVPVVTDLDPPIVTTANTEINCLQDIVTLPASIFGGEPFWEGPDGFASIDPNPIVTTPGVYTLTAFNLLNGCTATGVVEVIENLQGPAADIQAATTTLTCSNTAIVLTVSSDVPGLGLFWSGPSVNSDDPEVPVSNPGTYTLVASNPANGCTSSTSIDIAQDITAPEVQAVGGVLSCDDPLTTLSAASNTAGVVFAWGSPTGFVSTLQNPTVSQPGTYIVTVTAPNGCTGTATAEVGADSSLPDVSATGGLITCYNEVDTLRGQSATPGVTYRWTGPGGFVSTAQNAPASQPGIYRLVVTAPNGCTNSKEVFVVADLDPPVLSVNVTGSITCLGGSVEIAGSVAGGEAYWDGPSGFFSLDLTNTVTEPGVYTLTAYSPLNGCSDAVVAEVPADTLPPALEAVGGVLFCKNSEVVLNAIVDDQVVVTWVSSPQPVEQPIVTAPGDYLVVATNPLNGCTATDVATVTQVQPFLSAGLSAGATDCSGQTTLAIQPAGGTPPYRFEWSNGDTSATTVYPYGAVLAGCTITDEAGCSESLELVIQVADTLAVSLSAVNESAGGAGDGSASASILSGEGPFTYLWSTGATSAAIENLQGGTYTVTVTSAATGCSSVASIVVETTVRAGELPAGWHARLSPNPAGAFSLLDLKLPQRSDAEITLTDWSGRVLRVLFSGDLDQTKLQIPLENLPAGMYLVRIRAAARVHNLQLIKAE
jgi:hypothetical protein